MALVFNRGLCPINVVLPRGKAGQAVKRIPLPPGGLTPVDDKDWEAAKKIKMVKRYLDEDVLTVGKKAAKQAEKSGVSAAIRDMEKEAAKKAAEGESTEETEGDDTEEEEPIL